MRKIDIVEDQVYELAQSLAFVDDNIDAYKLVYKYVKRAKKRLARIVKRANYVEPKKVKFHEQF